MYGQVGRCVGGLDGLVQLQRVLTTEAAAVGLCCPHRSVSGSSMVQRSPDSVV